MDVPVKPTLTLNMPLLCYLSILALVACQDPPNDRQPRLTDAASVSRLHQGPYAAAIEAAKRAVERDPNSAVAHRNLADAYTRDNKLNRGPSSLPTGHRAAT